MRFGEGFETPWRSSTALEIPGIFRDFFRQESEFIVEGDGWVRTKGMRRCLGVRNESQGRIEE